MRAVGEDFAHMRLGHSAQVGAQQLEPQLGAAEEQQAVQDINRRQHRDEQEPHIQHREDLLVQDIQRQDAQNVQDIRGAAWPVDKHLALGHLGKDPRCHQVPQIPIVHGYGGQGMDILVPEPIEHNVHQPEVQKL